MHIRFLSRRRRLCLLCLLGGILHCRSVPGWVRRSVGRELRSLQRRQLQRLIRCDLQLHCIWRHLRACLDTMGEQNGQVLDVSVSGLI